MLILARHGETVWNVEGRIQGQKDSPLTARGVEQAKQLGRLRRLNPCPIFASPLGRVTATINLLGLSGKIFYDSRLEEMNFGDYEGIIKSQSPYTISAWDESYPNGESYKDVYNRAMKFLCTLPTNIPGPILIIAHETINKYLAGITLQLPREKILTLKQPNGLVWLV